MAYYHWRQARENDDPHANTVVAQKSDHANQLNRMQNEHLRNFLDLHPEFWGLLINIAEGAGQDRAWLSSQLNHVAEMLHKSIREQGASQRGRQPSPGKIKRVSDTKVGRLIKSPSKAITDWLKQAQSMLERAEFLSLDVFETTLLRRLDEPNDVFQWMATAGTFEKRPFQDIDQHRRLAEENLRQAIIEQKLPSFSEPDALDTETIYAAIAQQLKLSEDEKQELIHLEQRAERHLCVVNPYVLSLIDQAETSGIKVIFLSDTQWDEAFLGNLLSSKGIPFDAVFTSSSRGSSKASGGLFSCAIKECELEGMTGLHIGDRLQADYISPKKAGLKVLRWNSMAVNMLTADKSVPQLPRPLGLEDSFNVGTGRIRALEQLEEPSAPQYTYWERLGYEIAGPLLHGFSHWLAAQVHARRHQKLNFLARDGYNLKWAFDRIRNQLQFGVDTHYVYSSRRILQIAMLRHIPPAQWPALIRQWPGERVCDVLDVFGLTQELLETSSLWDGSLSLTRELDWQSGVFRETALFGEICRILDVFREEILHQSEVEASVYSGYLRECDLLSPDSAWVDCGWSGTSFYYLHKAFLSAGVTKIGGSHCTHAYLFGTWSDAARYRSKSLELFSYWLQFGQPSHRERLMRNGVCIIEFLLSAPHPMVRNVRKEGDAWKMIEQPGAPAPAGLSIHEAVLTGAGAYFNDFKESFPFPLGDAGYGKVMEKRLEQLILNPHRRDIQAWQQVLHGGAMSPLAKSPNVLPVVPPVTRWMGKKKIQRLYALCAWKEAFIQQLSPGQRDFLHP